MITDQKRTIRKAQGYDLGFEYKGVEYWINTSKWNEEKTERFCKETGLKVFRETKGNKNLVFYDPEYFTVYEDMHLEYTGTITSNIPQPLNAERFAYMFSNRDDLKYLDLSNWDTQKIKDFYSMFSCCSELKSLNLGGWNLKNALNVKDMFFGCASLQCLNLSNWDVSHLDNVDGMFYECISLYDKYTAACEEMLLHLIVEDSNKLTLQQLEMF